MEERGVTVAHITVLRWGQRFVPVFETRLNVVDGTRVELVYTLTRYALTF
jgi:transposase-like protein